MEFSIPVPIPEPSKVVPAHPCDHGDDEGCHDDDDDDVYVNDDDVYVDVDVDSYADAEHRRPLPSCWFNCLQSLQRSD